MTPTSAVSIFRQRAIKTSFLDVEGENPETTIFSNGKLMKFWEISNGTTMSFLCLKSDCEKSPLRKKSPTHELCDLSFTHSKEGKLMLFWYISKQFLP